MLGRKTVIHVNSHIIRRNKKTGEREPVISVKSGRANTYCNKVDILDDSGEIVASVIYSPEKPLKCGATCWVTTKNEIAIQ